MEGENNRAHYTALVREHNEKAAGKTGRQPVGYIRTFGCQQNLSDSEKLKGMLFEMGYAISAEPEGADIILFNTCAVREHAEDRAFGNLTALKAAKRRNKDLIIGLCGCMVQQPQVADKIREKHPYVDLVVGTHAAPKLPELIWKKITEGGHVADISEGVGDGLGEDLPTRRDGSLKAWVPVMYGCDNFCAFCVVPLVRGRERSREPEKILAEISELVRDGYKDITLLGQNVNSYGKTLDPLSAFPLLLRKIHEIPGEFRVRFMTSHPKDCTKELIDAIADCEKICSHIHLPVQSGSDRILEAMNRGYTAREYLDLIDYAREKIPGVAFTSDIIVGFPGEGEADFAATLDLVEKVGYHALFTFLYSKREGTKAAELPDPTPRAEKIARLDKLLELQRVFGRRQYDDLVGKTLRVLAEGPGKTHPNKMTGRSEQNVIVEFDGDASQIGEFVNVKIEEALQWAVLGKVVDESKIESGDL